MKIKTSELIDAPLDWAVAKCEGYRPAKREKRAWGWASVPAPEKDHSWMLINEAGFTLYLRSFGPSTDWSQGGPIIERERVDVNYDLGDKSWTGAWYGADEYTIYYGDTPLVAAMRCYVASKLGEEVEIPEELVKANGC